MADLPQVDDTLTSLTRKDPAEPDGQGRGFERYDGEPGVFGLAGDEEAGEVRRLVATRSFLSTTHEGPLPAPELLAGYGQVLADLPERIVRQFEAEAQHRRAVIVASQDLALREQAHRYELVTRGQHYALVISLAVITVGCIAVFMGQGLAGLGTVVLALASLVGAFIYSMSKTNQGTKPEEEKPQTDADEQVERDDGAAREEPKG